MKGLKHAFLLDKDITFLNHGSFGACPHDVFNVYQDFQRQLERNPVEFLSRKAPQLFAEARQVLANYLHIAEDDVVYFPNPTTAINMVARNINLQPGDEILTTDHEYGAMDRTWRFVCRKTGAKYVQRSIKLPVTSHEDFVDAFWNGVTKQTKVIFISQITSPTALIFPVREICHLARQAGILSIIDGAHSPGQIPLDLGAINADIFAGACHKWLCAPKGAAFLYAQPHIQSILEPLVVSWGYEAERPGTSQFIDYHEWQGTRDLAAFLSVPSAIQFQENHSWDNVRVDCHALALQARKEINDLTGLEAISPDSPQWIAQMVTIRLPQHVDPEVFKERLYNEYRLEVQALIWQNSPFLRLSFQAYNQQEDLDLLLEALNEVLT